MNKNIQEINMYEWLKIQIDKNFSPIRQLKKDDGITAMVYTHKNSNNRIVVKEYSQIYPIYKVLVSYENEYIANVLEVAFDDNKTLVVEEYIEGISVAQKLELGTIEEVEAVNIIRLLCEGLWDLHKIGIVHRDIKPENIILTGGMVKIIDFNAARLVKTNKTHDTVVLGTVGYAPPEQYGENQTDSRSDIYAIGILMNVMLSGRHPAEKIVSGKYKQIIEKATMISPGSRFQTVKELQIALSKKSL